MEGIYENGRHSEQRRAGDSASLTFHPATPAQMRAFISRIRVAVLESPGWKTFFSALIPIFVGVLSGTFVVEITVDGKLDWTLFAKSKSFYSLCALTFISYLYFKELYLYERQTERFLDADYCVAYMRSKCLPEAAERYKELIRGGNFGELAQAMDEVERILK
jgi:hypothetical protein